MKEFKVGDRVAYAQPIGAYAEVLLRPVARLVKIPAGISSGKKLRLAGKGIPGPYGGPAGDLYLNIQVQPHPIFSSDGDDLYVERIVSFSQACLGATIDVPTLSGGSKRLKIPAGTQSNTKIRMKGFGAPHLKGEGQGDQFVLIFVDVPKKLNARQSDLVRKERNWQTPIREEDD